MLQETQTLMWIGQARKDGSVPAYCFYITQPSVIEGLKGVLTKAIIETNTLAMFASQSKSQSSKSETSSQGEIDA